MRKAPCLFCRNLSPTPAAIYGYCNKHKFYKDKPTQDCVYYVPPNYEGWQKHVTEWYKEQADKAEIRYKWVREYFSNQIKEEP